MNPNQQMPPQMQGQAPQQGQNPFSGIIQEFLSRQQAQLQPDQQPTQPLQASTNGKAMPDTDITHPGVAPQSQSALISAINNINNFVKNSQSRDDISIAQSILALLADLLRRDKTTANQVADQGSQPLTGA